MVLWRAVSAADILEALARLIAPKARRSGPVFVLPAKSERPQTP